MRSNSLKSVTQISLGAALLSVSAWISFGAPVAVTMQTFSLSLLLILLGGKKGSAITLLYLALGAIGIPVFSGFRGGIGHIFSESGGFIFGFLLFSLTYLLVTNFFGDGTLPSSVALVLGALLLYATGTLWYAARFSGGESLGAIISVAVLPYVPFDAIKITLALIVGKRLKKYIK